MRAKLLIPLLLILATGFIYWDVAHFEFTNFDDNSYITDNRFVREGLSWESITWAFTRGHTLDGNWVPLTWLSLTCDASVFGSNAGGFHATNVVLHASNAVLLYVVLLSMTAAPWRSGFVAALFAMHPLHVESVAWVAERKDVLSAFFGLLAIAGFVGYARRPERNEPGRVWYLFALLAFVGSLMSKQMLVTLPFVLLLLDYWPLRRTKWIDLADAPQSSEVHPDSPCAPAFPNQPLSRLLLEKIPFLLIAVVFCAIAFGAQQRAGAVSTLGERPLPDRLANAVVTYAAYLRQTVWPSDLAVFYPYPDGIPVAQVVGSGCLLLVISAVAVWQVRRRPYLLVGWLFYLGTLVPVIGLVPIGLQRMADRYTYVPLIGVFIAATWWLACLSKSPTWRRVVLPIGCAAVLIACSLATRQQVQHWRDGEALFRRAIAVTQDNAVAQNMLGNALLENDEVEEAASCFAEAIRIQPNFTLAHYNRAQALLRLQRRSEAIVELETAVGLDPSSHIVRTALADAYRDSGRLEEAIEQYEQALSSAPGHVAARTNLANLFRDRGELRQAVEHYQAALSSDPNSIVTHANLGTTLFQLGQPDDGIFHLREALRLDRRRVATLVNLGIALAAVGKKEEAIVLLDEALQLDPNNSAARAAAANVRAVGKRSVP